MKSYLLAATLVAAMMVPVAAAEGFYVMFDKTTKTCSVAKSAPTETEKFSMMGQYGSEADANMAMAGMTKCKKR